MRARIAPTGGSEEGVEVVQSDSRVQYTGSLHSDGGYLVYFRAGTLLAQPFDLAGRRVTGDPKAIASHVSSFGYSGAADFSVSARGVLAYQSLPAARNSSGWTERVNGFLLRALPGSMPATCAFRRTDARWQLRFSTWNAASPMSGCMTPALEPAGKQSPDPAFRIYRCGRRTPAAWSICGTDSWPRLALSSLDGTPDPEPMPNTGFMAPTDWSPDGRFILYNNSALPAITQRFPSDVFAIDMARGRKVIPLLKTQFFENGAVFSPDGKWLAFLSDESGKAEIYMQAIDPGDDSLRVTGERFLISREGAQCLRWRKDAQGALLPGLGRTSVRRTTRFSPGGSPRGEARGAFHDRSPKPAPPFTRLSHSTCPPMAAVS